MWVVPKDSENIDAIRTAIQTKIAESRFTVGCIEVMRPRNSAKLGIKISTIRLRNRKPYCGQHPGPCQTPLFGKKRKLVGTWLEGADWVGFNDMLNDLLDRMNVEADVWSYNRESKARKYWIRHGGRRRFRYDYEEEYGTFRVFAFWSDSSDDDFIDCRDGKPALSSYPANTPGLAAYSLDAEQRWITEFEHVH